MERANFSYADAGDPLVFRALIRVVEIATGQPLLKRLYEENQRAPYADGPSFFEACMRRLSIDVRVDAMGLARVPRAGPLIFVANHPFGIVDGLAMGSVVERARDDFLILTNAVLLRAPEMSRFVLPVDFAGTREALATNVESRARARAHLAAGGSLVVFPAGAMSTSPDRYGRAPAVDIRWPPFVAQLLQKAQAPVVPVYFAGQNSRLFQIVSHMNQTARLALLVNEVRNTLGMTLPVGVGEPVPFEDLASLGERQAIADELMRRTYALAQHIPGEPQRLAGLPEVFRG